MEACDCLRLGLTDSASNSCLDFNGKTTITLSPRGLPCFEGLNVI